MGTFSLILSFAGAAAVGLFLTPLSVSMARRWGVLDLPGTRKVHSHPTPRLGGLAIAIATVVVSLIVTLLARKHWAEPNGTSKLIVLLASALFVLGVGVLDDLIGLRSNFKLLALIAAALTTCSVGLRIDAILLHGREPIELGWVAWPLTVLWIVGVTVSINFIDGLDGLAGGIAAIACGVIAVTASIHGHTPTAIVALAMLGSLVSFLVFNFNPARVFMGDGGSMFVGFTLGALTVLQHPATGSTVGLMLPALALAVPLLDTALTIVRRSIIHRSLFVAERDHIHHRLLVMGLCPRHAVYVLYAASLTSAGVGMLALLDNGWATIAGLSILVPLLLGLFRTAGSTRVRETIAAIRRNRAIGKQTRAYQRAFEELMPRFREVPDFAAWWESVCAAAQALDFVAVNLPVTRRDGSSAVMRWRRDDEKYDAKYLEADTLQITVPVAQRRHSNPLRVSAEVAAVPEFLEVAGQRVALFARLVGDHSVARLPDSTKRVKSLGPSDRSSKSSKTSGAISPTALEIGGGTDHGNGNGHGHANGHGEVAGHSNGNGHVSSGENGHSDNGHSGNGHAGNGHAGNGHAGNGHAASGQGNDDLHGNGVEAAPSPCPLPIAPQFEKPSLPLGLRGWWRGRPKKQGSAVPLAADLLDDLGAEAASGCCDRSKPRVAIVHDFLYCYAGAERVLEQILNVYPDAELFALFDFLPAGQRGFIRDKTVTTSFIQRLPLASRRHRMYLPLMPLAIEQLDVSAYDIVISSSYLAAKGVITRPDQLHVCYCHTPVRFAWDQQNQYLGQHGLMSGIKSFVARLILHYIRSWDVRSSNGVDLFLTNSDFVGRRIQKVYRRTSTTVHPPVDTEQFSLHEAKEDFYLTASRLVPYKRVELIVEAFNRMPERRLIIVGDGPEFDKIKALAGPNVRLVGHQSAERLRQYMQLARAFLFAAEEDFGIVPVEAQACGTPVIAFGRGGVTESVVDGQTGVFFHRQTADAIIGAVHRFERGDWDAGAIRANAERFSAERFRHRLATIVQARWLGYHDRGLSAVQSGDGGLAAPGMEPGIAVDNGLVAEAVSAISEHA